MGESCITTKAITTMRTFLFICAFTVAAVTASMPAEGSTTEDVIVPETAAKTTDTYNPPMVDTLLEATEREVMFREASNKVEVLLQAGTETLGVRNYGKDCWNGCRHKQGKCGWCGSGMCCRLGWPNHKHGCNGKMGIRGRGHVCIPSPKPKGNENQCISNAHKSIASVLHEVKNAQSILNRMDNGSHCAKKGQAAVQNAKASLRQKQAAEKKAHKNLSKSRSAKITVTVTYSSANRNCKAFTNSNAFRRARRNEQAKRNALTRAKQQVKDAKNFLKKMEAKAAADRCKCKARVTKAAKAAVTQARKLTGERKRSIIRELMLICLVKARSKSTPTARNNAGNACKNQGLPSSYNSKLVLHQTKLVRMNFKCSSGHGACKDKCGGFRVSKVCGGGYVAIKTESSITWNRYGNYRCPKGWYWPTAAKYFQITRRHGCFSNNAKSRGHYAYYNRCGWTGYNPPNNGSCKRATRYYIRFSDSRNGRCHYQHAGNYMGFQNNYSCSTGNFLGIACVKNGH